MRGIPAPDARSELALGHTCGAGADTEPRKARDAGRLEPQGWICFPKWPDSAMVGKEIQPRGCNEQEMALCWEPSAAFALGESP